VLAGASVKVHPVSARASYLQHYAKTRGTQAVERKLLQTFVDSRTFPVKDLREPMRALSVDTVCISRRRVGGIEVLKALGFHEVEDVGRLTCLRK
jgi:hypothetical protein